MRDVTFAWVVDNFDVVEQWIPFSYPRSIQAKNESSALNIAPIVLGGLAILLVITVSALVYHSQHRRVIAYAHFETGLAPPR